MQTNFFRHIAKMGLTGDLHFTLRPTEENSFVLSVLLNNEQCGDEARKLIPPLNLKGTAEELDNGFFDSISTPLQTASGLMVDMESFMKQLEETKKQSAMEKEKTDKEKKEKKPKRRNSKMPFRKPKHSKKRVNIKKRGQYFRKYRKIPISQKLFARSRMNTKSILPQVFLQNLPMKMFNLKNQNNVISNPIRKSFHTER